MNQYEDAVDARGNGLLTPQLQETTMKVCDKCGSVRPNWVHYWAEFHLNCFVGAIVWVCYCRRPMDYFKDMRNAFRESRERCIGD